MNQVRIEHDLGLDLRMELPLDPRNEAAISGYRPPLNGLGYGDLAKPSLGSGKLLVPLRLARANFATARPTNEGSHARSRPIFSHGSLQISMHQGRPDGTRRRRLHPFKRWVRSRQFRTLASNRGGFVEDVHSNLIHGNLIHSTLDHFSNTSRISSGGAIRRRHAANRRVARFRGGRVGTC